MFLNLCTTEAFSQYNPFTNMASCATGSPFSVNEHPAIPGVMVYPNPFDEKLTVSAGTGEILEIILFDITSREILHQNFTSSGTLNTGQLAKGINLYKIMDSPGGGIASLIHQHGFMVVVLSPNIRRLEYVRMK